MLPTRRGAVLLLLCAVLGSGKSPTEAATVCERYQGSDLIFTGSAETTWITMLDTRKSPVHKRSEKSKRVRFLVREWFKGQRRNTVEVWLTPADCPLQVQADQTYLIYARLNKDSGRIETNGCMGTVAVEKAASDLPFLTAALQGAAQATRVSGNAGGAGVNVQAKSGINVRYATSDAAGKFTLDGLAAGDWEFSVVGGAGAAKPVQLAPNSCAMVDLAP